MRGDYPDGVQPLTAAVLGKAVLTLACGVLVGAVGTVMHRASPPWGLLGALALALTASVTARAWAGWVTWVGYLGGLFFAVQALAQTGPGGDLMVPAGEAIGWVWVVGSLVLALGVGLLPARLFTDGPAEPRRTAGPAAPEERPSKPDEWPAVPDEPAR